MCPSGVSLKQDAAEKSRLRPAFEVIDTDHDGKISQNDLQSFCAELSGDNVMGKDTIGMMMSAADSDKDGYVEYHEFEHMVERPRRRRRRRSGGVMEDVFRIMDRDGDGKLSHEDLKGFMSWAGLGARDEDIRAMMMLGGGEKEGGITYDEFLKILGVDDLF